MFYFQSTIFSGPVLSIAREALSVLDDYIVDQISLSTDDLWIRAVIRDDISTVNNLAITHPELINQKMNFAKPWENKNETTALHYATQAGHAETLTILLAHGASKKIKNAEGLNAQQIAHQSQSPIMKRLISSPKIQKKYFSRKSA